MAVQFRLLGGVAARVDGESVDLGHARRQCVLVALLVEANRAVSVDQLIERVWAERPPNQARNALHGYLGRLRTALAAAPGVEISRSAGGYLLAVDEQAVDLHRFRQLLARARAAADDQALVLYPQALGLWRGEAFAGLDTPWLATVRAGLEAERLAAELDYADLRLRCGQHTELVPVLSAQLDQRPLDERLAAQLMLALYRSGRQADALECYQRTRQRLAEELGTEPSLPLQRAHQQILQGDPAGAAGVVPRNDLPGDVADFTGRVGELRELLAVAPAECAGGATVLISAIDGMAGIGKTTLALRAAHHLADRYPDGQLFVDLHGHTEGAQPVEPATALASLLRAVGVPIDQVPDSAAERASRWRAELARRRVLVVLDNAATAAQVRPLLPGTAGSLTLVTSRRRLADLDTTCSLSLDVLPAADAIALFSRIAGQQRVAAEPVAVDQVAQLCGYLPLALRIAAARLRSRPAWSVAHLASRLGDEQRRLTELSAGDRSVAAAFALSYHHLTPVQQRVFRLLGLVPGPHWDAYLAAALTDIPVVQAEEVLEQLLDVHLLTQPAPGRYRFHDLLGAHARAVAEREESAAGVDAAVARMLAYYCATGMSAIHLAIPLPGITDRPFQTVTATAELPAFAGHHEALGWLKAERANLDAAQQRVPDTAATLLMRLDLLMLLGFAQCLGGHGAEALNTTRRLLALIPGEDPGRRTTAVMLCATVERMFGSPAVAKSMLRGELRRQPDDLTGESILLRLKLAIEHILTGDGVEASLLLDELDAVEQDAALRFGVTMARAMAAYLAGDFPSTLVLLDLADRVLPELSTPETIHWLEAVAWMCRLEVRVGRVDSGLARADRLIELAGTSGQNYVVESHVVSGLLGVKAFTLGRMGRLTEAAALAEESVELARLVDLPEPTTMALAVQALVLGWAGDYHRALHIGTEAAQLAQGRQEWASVLARSAPGLVLTYSGSLDAGRSGLRSGCDEHELVVRDETLLLILLEALANAEAQRGRTKAAAELADRADRAHHPEHAANTAMADLIRAHALTGADPVRSAELALRAAEQLRRAGWTLEEGRARLRAGLSLANAGHHGRALPELAASVALFDTSGARHLHAQAATAHAELSHRAPFT